MQSINSTKFEEKKANQIKNKNKREMKTKQRRSAFRKIRGWRKELLIWKPPIQNKPCHLQTPTRVNLKMTMHEPHAWINNAPIHYHSFSSTKLINFIYQITPSCSIKYQYIYHIPQIHCHSNFITPSVSHNLSLFDPPRILRNVIESGLKKLVACESYFYILVL